VTARGIRYKRYFYQAEFLKEHIKEQVQIETATSTNDEKIMVYSGEKFLGYAIRGERGNQESDPENKMGMAEKVKEGLKSVIGIASTGSLDEVSTDKLIRELAARTGVSMVKVKEGQQYKVSGNNSRIKEWGPAVVIVIKE